MLNKTQLKALLVKELPRLRRFSYGLTGNKSDADDLVQNLVEKMLRKGMSKDIPALPWFFKICKNLWIDEIRSNQNRKKLLETSINAQDNKQEPGQKVMSWPIFLPQWNNSMMNKDN